MKRIDEFPDYLIYPCGTIRSLHTGRICSQNENNCGYLRVELSNKGKRKKYFVHRLVAEIYVDGYSNGLQVNHIDGNKTNNCVSNLEWVSASENMRHSFKVLNRKVVKRFDLNNSRTKIPKSEIPKIINLAKHKTYKEIARLYGCNPKYVGMVVRGERRGL